MAFKMKAGKEGPMKKNFGSLIKSAITGGLGSMSPMDKELVGDQHKLPEHLKKKIEAAPESPNKLVVESKEKKQQEEKKEKENKRNDRVKTTRRNDPTPIYIGRTEREQRKLDAQYRRGERQGHDIKTINARIEKGMDYQRKGPKLPAKKTTKLDVAGEELMDYRTKKQKRKDFNKMKREQKKK